MRNPNKYGPYARTGRLLSPSEPRTTTLEEMVGTHRESLPNRSGPRARERQQEVRNYTRKL